jgi:hypothetical protein
MMPLRTRNGSTEPDRGEGEKRALIRARLLVTALQAILIAYQIWVVVSQHL